MLHLALELNTNSEIAHILIKNGAEVNTIDHLGRKPIHIAALRGRADIWYSLNNPKEIIGNFQPD